MKITNLFWSLALLIVITSCKKEDDKTQILQEKKLKINTQDISNLISNPEDEYDSKINNYLYQAGKAIRELIFDKEFNSIIIEMAKSNRCKCAFLSDLKTTKPHIYNRINSKLSELNLSIELIDNDLTYKTPFPDDAHPETLELEKYELAIFVPNTNLLNEEEQPILSPNVEVNSLIDESIEDNVIAWKFNTLLNTFEDVLISEEFSLQTKTPLFFMDNGVRDNTSSSIEYSTPLNLDREPATPQANGGKTRYYSSYEHSIRSNSYRYESWYSGKSEFAIVACRITPDGTTPWIGGDDGQRVINKIRKRDIGKMQYKWKYHADDWKPYADPSGYDKIQYGVNMVFWNTFERDWNRSLKNVGTCTANGSTIYLSGNMKYSSNWYAWKPSTTHIHYTRFQWINNDWAHWNNSWKSHFRIWKVYK